MSISIQSIYIHVCGSIKFIYGSIYIYIYICARAGLGRADQVSVSALRMLGLWPEFNDVGYQSYKSRQPQESGEQEVGLGYWGRSWNQQVFRNRNKNRPPV